MKKFLLSMALVIIAILPSYCQDTLKISKGKITTELNVNPFIGELSFNNAIKQIKFRYFQSNLSALRFSLIYNTNNHKVEEANPYGQISSNFKDIKKSTTIGLSLGYEKHFIGTRRLSPYLGFDLGFVNKIVSQDLTVNSNETKVKGAWLDQTSQYGNVYQERAFFSYGLNLISGFDFYIAQNFYFGYELGFGFSVVKYKDIDVTNLYGSGTPSGGGSSVDRNDKSFQLGPNFLNGIRLGFVF